jgi:hypothetical protein
MLKVAKEFVPCYEFNELRNCCIGLFKELFSFVAARAIIEKLPVFVLW